MQLCASFLLNLQKNACDIIIYVHQLEKKSGVGLTSQLTTAQLGDLHVVEGALHCSGAPGPVVTSYRSERGPNCKHKKNKQFNTHIRLFKNMLSKRGLKAHNRKKTIPKQFY